MVGVVYVICDKYSQPAFLCMYHTHCMPFAGTPNMAGLKLFSHSTFRCLALDGFRTYDVVLFHVAEPCTEQPDAQRSGTYIRIDP